MTPEQGTAVITAAVAVFVAACGFAAAWFKSRQDAIETHLVALTAGQVAITKAAGAGAIYPTWNQLADPGDASVLPSGRYEECGEECCSIVIYGQHGVQTSADSLRVLIGGPARSPLTTAPDLIKILALNNVPAQRQQMDAASAPAALETLTAGGGVAICLGTWVAPGILHWILVTRADANGCGADDPWGGRRRVWDWDAWRKVYAGDMVFISRHPDAR